MGKNAVEFLDNLTEFLCETEGLTTQELEEDLCAKGIDVESILFHVASLLHKHGFAKAAGRMGLPAPPQVEPIPSIGQDISQLQAIILSKYRRQIMQAPAITHCREALEQFPITALEEAVTRCPVALRDGTNASNIVNMVIKYATNTSWGRPKEEAHPGKLPAGKREDLEHELKQLEEVFSDALMDEDLSKFRPSKQGYLDEELHRINNIRGVLGMELKERVVLDGDVPF